MFGCFSKSSTSPSLPVNESEKKKRHDVSEKALEEKKQHGLQDSGMDNASEQKKPGGWRAMPFILGNETLERLGTIGLLANFMVYLMREFHMEQVDASNVLNLWSGLTNLAPIIGAFLSDAYIGRFKTIGFACIATLTGMVTVTLTSWVPALHPQAHDAANKLQLGILFMGLAFLSIGSGGIRPCSMPFGVDQFDQRTEEGVKGVASFFNWYYMTFTLVLLITQTVVVYIQDQVSWVLGFGIPTVLMGFAVVLFLAGRRVYIYVKPEGSIFSGICKVFVQAWKKRKLKIPDVGAEYYDPPVKATILDKLPLTNQFRWLNKAAMIREAAGTGAGAGSPANHEDVCSIQQVEEVKCLIRVIPVWSAGIISLTAMSQQGTFTVSQALAMDRHLGRHFEIPAGSVSVISLIVITLWLPFYDRILVPRLRRITKHKSGITLLQRIGVGIVFAILSMIMAGIIERHRRASALAGGLPISVFWLAPQLILMGFCEAFNIIGQLEFFNTQFPEHMRSMANALFSLSFAGSSYLSTLIVNTVHGVTGDRNHPDWLNKNINAGKLDYFYYLIAGLGVFNLVYFLFVARRYRYKTGLQIGDFDKENQLVDLEISSVQPLGNKLG